MDGGSCSGGVPPYQIAGGRGDKRGDVITFDSRYCGITNTSEKQSGASSSDGGFASHPNSYGRLGSPEHRAPLQKLESMANEESIALDGFRLEFEYSISTPNGIYKSRRIVDAALIEGDKRIHLSRETAKVSGPDRRGCRSPFGGATDIGFPGSSP